MLQLNNQNAIITGGGSGIGKATALLFAQQGAHVHVVDLNGDDAAQTVAAITAAGGNATAHTCNVVNQHEVFSLMNIIGQIDILVNSAGIAHIGRADTTSEADFDRVFSVNVKGVYNCLHAALPKMLQQGKGVILNVASIAGSVGLTDRFAYSMSKGAVNAMTLSVARDYLDKGIRCNSVSPARVHTPFVDAFLAKNYPGNEAEMMDKLSKSQPIGRMAKPSEVAMLILYLCSDEASFITGCDYPIDGGFLKLNN